MALQPLPPQDGAEPLNNTDEPLNAGSLTLPQSSSSYKHLDRTAKPNLRPVEWLNFFLADVQTGLGPFLAAYLAANAWNPGSVGFVLTFGGLVGVALQTPAGAIIDATRHKRGLIAAALGALVCGAALLASRTSTFHVYASQLLIGGAGPFLGPAVGAITLGIVGARQFDAQFGRNQAFNSAGNVVTALLMAGISVAFGYHAIFWTAALLTIPTAICLWRINGNSIDYARSRGAHREDHHAQTEGVRQLLKDRVLLYFLGSVFLFHLANAAMLPELGEMLARGKPRAAAPFMAACVTVTQLVIAALATWIGRRAEIHGRKPLLLLGYGVLPIRGVLYMLTTIPALLIAIQILDGVANAIYTVVAVLVIKDRTDGTGRFNLAVGALATMVGVGAALSNAVGGLLVQHAGFRASFLGLAALAAVAFLILWALVPETGTISEDSHQARDPQHESA
jgi:predicted MFS family arabinose efflux permease